MPCCREGRRRILLIEIAPPIALVSSGSCCARHAVAHAFRSANTAAFNAERSTRACSGPWERARNAQCNLLTTENRSGEPRHDR